MLSRRGFLKTLGSGLLMSAAPTVALVESVRRFWQVPRGAPVRDLRLERELAPVLALTGAAYNPPGYVSLNLGGELLLIPVNEGTTAAEIKREIELHMLRAVHREVEARWAEWQQSGWLELAEPVSYLSGKVSFRL